MRKLLVIAALALPCVFTEERAALGPAAIGAAPSSAPRAVPVHNTGTAVLSINPSTSLPPFSVVPQTDSFTVMPGGLDGVTVRFRPTTTGAQSGVLGIARNDPDVATVAVQLQGATVGVPNISVTPAQLDLGAVVLGQSTARALTVHNTGTAALTVHIPSPIPPFSVDAPAGLFIVAPNGHQPITVQFSPTTAGVQSGELHIASTDPDAATVTVPLHGVGSGVPNLSVAPSLLDFGAIVLGQSVTRALTVHNTGTAALTVTLASLNPHFSVVAPAGLFTVAPGGYQPVTVQFSPTTAGAQSGELHIASDDPDARTVFILLHGVGAGVPNISVAPSLLDFGTVVLGQSVTRALTVHNTGTAALTVTLASLNPHFSVVAPAGPFTVAPGGQQPVRVRFRPTVVEAQSGELRLASTDPDARTVTVPLHGAGRGVPNIVVSQASADFGPVSLGQSASRMLTVRNTGSTALTVTTLGSTHPRFSVDALPVPFTVAPGGQQPVTVRFRPTVVGAQSGELRLASTDPDEAIITIQLRGEGIGVPNINVAPALLDFGAVALGQSSTRTLTVRNTGAAALALTTLLSTTPRFSVDTPAGPFTVAPGGQQSVTVRFRPTVVGAQSGELRLASTDPDEAIITTQLQGAGVGVPNINVSHPGLDFGDVSSGQSGTRELTVRNTGAAELTVTTLASPNTHFSVVAPVGPFTVAPNAPQPVTVTVRFSPTTDGPQSGELRLASNDPDEAIITTQLQGRGVGCAEECHSSHDACVEAAGDDPQERRLCIQLLRGCLSRC